MVSVGKRIEDSSFVIVAHRFFPSIVDDLKEYLLDNRCKELWYIIHEFNVLETRRSFIEHYKEGRLIGTHYSFNYRFIPDPYVNLKDFIYTIFWMLLRVRRGIDVYIGLGGFNVLCGSLLRRVKDIRKIVFYTIDYAPVRFSNRLLNRLYHWIDRFELTHASETWNVSPRMAEGREKTMGLRRRDYPNQVVVPIGVWFDDVRRYDFEDINRKELMFIGTLVRKQGVQLVLDAVPRIVKEVPGFQFRIIGTGDFEGELKGLARDLGVGQHVIFEGPIPDQDEANEKLARAALAVAMYDNKHDDFSYYADPGKIKTYLSAGLPVLLTDVPHNADEIQERSCGKVLEYDVDAIATAVIELMNDEDMLKEYRENAVRYARMFDWNRIFENNLGRLL